MAAKAVAGERGRWADRRVFQYLAVALCVLFGAAMVMNTQMEGEASWFWYASLLRLGVKLYAQLHLPLQPLFVLETAAWTGLFGGKALTMACLSLIHVLVLSFGFLLVLRSSDWPDWQKGVVVAAAFVLFLQAPAYRFDDYHVLAQICIVYSLALLLRLERAETLRGQIATAAGLGVLSGLAMTTRLNDGAALLAAGGVIGLFLTRRRQLVVLGVHLGTAILTVLLVVELTGDSVRDYIANTMLHAAASKGGTGSILTYPFLLFVNAAKVQRIGGKRVLLFLLATTLLGLLLRRVWAWSVGRIVVAQLVLAVGVFLLCPRSSKEELLLGLLIFTASIALILLVYALTPVLFARAALHRIGRLKRWNTREILMLLPLGEMASASASTAGQPRQGFYAQTAICLVLLPVIWRAELVVEWVRATFISLMVMLGVTGVSSKYLVPYSWQNYLMARMFTDRVWYQNPAHGPLYVERDLLALSLDICRTIDGSPGSHDLLSLPFSYPNYVCGISPWHGYVQTYFDTSTRATINQLMGELNQGPPEWIVYQRQMEVLRGQEWLYNHNQPLAQRDLDEMIERKIGDGSWTLVEKRNYLVGDGWLIIQTHR